MPASRRMSHSGKALLDILETYPRDELFQTSVDELLPGRRGRAAPARAAAAAVLRPPRRLRPLPVVPGLPAARPLHHAGPRADAADPQGRRWARRRSTTPRASASRCSRGCTSSCGRRRARRCATSTRPRSSSGWPRPPGRGATTSRSRSTEQFGEEPGARLARVLRRRVPRGVQGGLPAARRRPPTYAGWRTLGDAADRACRCTSRSTRARASRGSRCSAPARR